MVPAGQAARLDEADTWLSAHPEAGLSVYDRHADGSGCSLVSMRRPVPNFRPDFVWWNTGAPERFGADLYITDFLDHRGEAGMRSPITTCTTRARSCCDGMRSS